MAKARQIKTGMKAEREIRKDQAGHAKAASTHA